ncbi:transcriptional regulator [Oceanobacillus piezotolerans]|uniref:Transcriptional regulator n=1 Tax=Oceanobacillus piezotolerans TaxID=2448030 RepID=A0A498DQQ7_9BACI|nr:metalloregulator ArsR/SmtB family transcription factor [Oceanobacillus piezotolerans]RLL46809.1 transcriptional regulator [Oceanobacillus piezotolerans]
MNNNATCEIFCYDEEKVERIQRGIQSIDIASMTQIFKVMASENRAKIIYALCQDEELCVCDIASIIGVSIANTSHHLRTLHKQGMVNFRKEGKLAFYSLQDEHVKEILMLTLAQKERVMK